jgi:hypothetical protein
MTNSSTVIFISEFFSRYRLSIRATLTRNLLGAFSSLHFALCRGETSAKNIVLKVSQHLELGIRIFI